ncbi:MAG: PA14 domain-containing protein, partial [Kofleriaceae bacterium]
MRACWLLVLGGCSFRGNPAGSEQIDAPPVHDDAGREIVTWTIDEAGDFAKPGAVLGAAGIEPWGSLTSGAYIAGGVPVRGVGAVLWRRAQSNAELSWDVVANATVAGVGIARARDLGGDLVTAVGRYGVSGAGYSLLVEGELLLDQSGTHELTLDADDVAFLEIAPPGTTSYQRVAVARANEAVVPGTYAAAAPGWHPFRIGFSDEGGGQRFGLQHRPPGGSIGAIDRAHLRGRGDGLRGMHRNVFERQMLASVQDWSAVDARPLITADFAGETLPGMPGNRDDWSARWSGQFYAAVAGTYTLAARSDNGNVLALGDEVDQDHWARDDNGLGETEVTAQLDVGWHSLVVDYNEANGGNVLALELVASPDPDLAAGAPVPLARLRPVDARVRAVPRGVVGHDQTIVSGDIANQARIDLPVAGFAGEVPRAIDVTIHASNPHWEDMELELVRPDGTAISLVRPNLTGNRDLTFHRRVTTASFLNGPLDGTWHVRVWDDNNGGGHTGDGRLRDAYVTLHASGGHPVVAPEAIWTSQIVDLGDRPLIDVTRVAWTARTPTASS